MPRQALPSLVALAATALLASGCCDQTCDCPDPYLPADGSVGGDAEAGPGRGAGSATANNSPRIDTLTVSLKGCVGTFLAQTLVLSDPDGDEVTLAHRVAHAPQGATVRVKPSAPLTLGSGENVEVEVFSDLPGDVRIEYTVTDAFGLAGSGPYTVVYHFHDCTAGSDAAAGGAATGDADAGP